MAQTPRQPIGVLWGIPMSGVDYGRDALDFIEGLNGYNEVPAAMDALERAFGRFGFETIIVTGLPNPGQNFSQMVLAMARRMVQTLHREQLCSCRSRRPSLPTLDSSL
jgi:hypothetical protein